MEMKKKKKKYIRTFILFVSAPHRKCELAGLQLSLFLAALIRFFFYSGKHSIAELFRSNNIGQII